MAGILRETRDRVLLRSVASLSLPPSPRFVHLSFRTVSEDKGILFLRLLLLVPQLDALKPKTSFQNGGRAAIHVDRGRAAIHVDRGRRFQELLISSRDVIFYT